ncbi:MAG: crosslink repair DNA glycosylase YcaQ family protein [Planktotalea sp.]|uniref:winged helix-turn-helix domain-containing protein n=1 Tax=Planktotalea sp. TaxID=2029877 RepID=UPI003C78E0EE
MALPVLSNKKARAVFLDRHLLNAAPTGTGKGDDLLSLITQLGFVQVDSINTVERAHHMVLRARRAAYRPKNLTPLLERDHSLFEHWTHDASIIPAEFFPHWKLRFTRDAEKLRKQWRSWRREGFEEKVDDLLKQIANEGPKSSACVGEGEKRGSGGWWDWHPSKTALEYLWRTGALSVTRREAFKKFYDVTERVLDEAVTSPAPEQIESIDWLCNAALDRLGFATSTEIADFWDIVTKAEAKEWCARAGLIELDIEGTDGTLRRSFARDGLMDETPLKPTSRLRILSPFDPALRDRKRAERLFGFHYRIEIFVPEAKRQYGYYVFPIMESDKLIGRIDMKAIRSEDALNVTGLWWENGVQATPARLEKLHKELGRMARFAGVSRVQIAPELGLIPRN